MADVGFALGDRNVLRSQVDGGVFRVVPAAIGAFSDFGDCGLDWLSHFLGDQSTPALGLRFQDLRCAPHLVRPVFGRKATLSVETLGGKLELALNFPILDFFEAT